MDGGPRVSTGGDCQVVVAGPYGLSVAAHLQDGKIDVRVFDDPIVLARPHPKHEARSPWRATHIAESGKVP